MRHGVVAEHAHSVTEHRPDIDGLRAVAILTVLAFHAWEPLFPGGFIGVDIFFVISGFLISSIIFKGLQQQRFSFLDFYLRRVKRIFPALLLVLVTVWIAGWLLMLPDEFVRTSKHLATGAAFTANIALWSEAGYFDWTAELKPLLHLWSLGVEEQFYIGWPLLAFLAWRWRLNLLGIVAVIAVVSFVINVTMIEKYQTAVFYLPVTRIWEILLGTMLAWWLSFKHAVFTARVARHADSLSLLGLAMLIIAFCSVQRSSLFPGWWALLPTLGACLLIAAPQGWFNRRVLGSRPMVFIGLISYPLYLWHWPLLSLLRIMNRDSPTTIAAAVASAFVLAWLTWRWIERPIRSRQPGTLPALTLTGAVAVMGGVGLLGFLTLLQPRSASYAQVRNIIAATTTVAFTGPNLQPVAGQPDSFRRQGNSDRVVLIIGDSNAQQYYPRIDRLLTEHPTTAAGVVFATAGGCPPFPDVHDDHHAYCEGLLERAVTYAQRPEVASIVVAASWLGYFKPQPRYDWYVRDGDQRQSILIGQPGFAGAFASLEALLLRLQATGKQLHLVLPLPSTADFDPRRMVRRHLAAPGFEIITPVVTRLEMEQQMAPVATRLREIAGKYGISTIDPLAWLCPDRICPVLTPAGIPVYQDAGHLNPLHVRSDIRFMDMLFLPHEADQPPELISQRRGAPQAR
jgi:peptidoglycan/LPS O-acetylase OafA/YrhL